MFANKFNFPVMLTYLRILRGRDESPSSWSPESVSALFICKSSSLSTSTPSSIFIWPLWSKKFKIKCKIRNYRISFSFKPKSLYFIIAPPRINEKNFFWKNLCLLINYDLYSNLISQLAFNIDNVKHLHRFAVVFVTRDIERMIEIPKLNSFDVTSTYVARE